MNHLPDIVLVDVYLGGAREGIETARWLRDMCDASVVFVTAYTDDATLERIREVVPGSADSGQASLSRALGRSRGRGGSLAA